ncbi:MAG: signal peptidase II [Brevefilum sp.]
MKKILKEYWLMIFVAGLIVIVDQLTKAIVRANIPFGGRWMPLEWLAPYFRFVHWENTGAAFGLFQQGGVIFAILAVVVAVFIVVYYPQVPKEEKLMRLALAMQLGGALGNLIDRIVFGPVTDFISVLRFPVFNIADSSITIGVGVLILGLWMSEQREKSAQKAADQLNQENSEDPENSV